MQVDTGACRHPEISVRSAEGINKTCAWVTEVSIRLWYRDLKTFLAQEGHLDVLEEPKRIFNGDESGFSLCLKTGKVPGPKGEANYTVNIGTYRSALKRSKSFFDVRPHRINKLNVLIKEEQLRDVENLLTKHYGSEWRNRIDLSYYEEVMIGSSEIETTGMKENEEEICEIAVPVSRHENLNFDLRIFSLNT
ncbi:hypothetical protein ACJJTC_016066 [Scirpophaga incertulas]